MALLSYMYGFRHFVAKDVIQKHKIQTKPTKAESLQRGIARSQSNQQPRQEGKEQSYVAIFVPFFSFFSYYFFLVIFPSWL